MRLPDSTRRLRPLPIATFALCVLFSSCAQYATVSERKPRFHPIRATLSSLVSVEQEIANALKTGRRDPLAALGGYLAAAAAAAAEFGRNPKDEAARADYNFAVARIITTIRDGKLDPWKPAAAGAVRGRRVCARLPAR